MKRMDIHNLSKKDIRNIHTWVRAVIQLLYFLFLPSAFTAAFSGVKYIFQQLGAGAKIELTSFVSVLLVLCAYTMYSEGFSVGLPVPSAALETEYMHFMYGPARN